MRSTGDFLTECNADPRRFGNLVSGGVSETALAASGKGPGPVSTTVSVTAECGLQVAFLARIAGVYSLTVISVATGQPLAGMPLQAS